MAAFKFQSVFFQGGIVGHMSSSIQQKAGAVAKERRDERKMELGGQEGVFKCGL